MSLVKLEKDLGKNMDRKRLKSDPDSLQNINEVKNYKREVDLNLTEFEKINFNSIPSCFQLFFRDKFLSLLLDNRKRTFANVLKCIEIQWQSLCPKLKSIYEKRYEVRRQSDVKVDVNEPFSDVKQKCLNLFKAAEKAVLLSRKKSSFEVIKSFKYFCDCKSQEKESPRNLRQDWNDLSDVERSSLCIPAASSNYIKIELKEQSNFPCDLNEVPNFGKDIFEDEAKLQVIVVPSPDISGLCAGEGCDFHYTSLDSLLGHVSTTSCSGIGPELKCPLCTEPTIFGLASEFKIHLLLHKGFTQICSDCPSSFSTEQDLVEHLEQTHLFPCQSCLKMFSSPNSLLMHRLNSHKFVKYFCEFCVNVSFPNCGKLQDHLKTVHKLSSHEELESSFKCPDCLIVFDTKAKLKYHRLKLHGKWQGRFSCDQCDKSYGSESNLRRHLRDVHKSGFLVKQVFEGKLEVSSSKTCSECPFSTSDKNQMTVHMRKHTGERPFTCSQCTFGFYKKSDLKVHLKSCKGIKYQCQHCQEVFHFKKQLQEHLLWSTTCGKVQHEEGEWSLTKGPSQRYLTNKPTMIRVNVSRDRSVVGLNFENIIDKESFVKRTKKSRCGLCTGCERDTDCGSCKICSNRKSKSRICELRKCTNRVFHYDMIKSADRDQVDIQFEQSVVEFEQNVEGLSSGTNSVNFEMELVGSEIIEPVNTLCDYPEL